MSKKYKLCLLWPLPTYFLGPICMDLWVHKLVSFSPVNLSCQFNYHSNHENLKVHTISVLYQAHLCKKCSLGISNFLEEISSLSHSVVFLYFFPLIAEEGFFLSLCYSLELCIQMLVPFLFSFAFSFSSFHSYL